MIAPPKDRRGHGIARKCLRALCTELLESSAAVTLHVDLENKAARAAYEAVGMRKVGRLQLCLRGA